MDAPLSMSMPLDLRWCALPDGRVIDCARHKLLRRLLAALVAARVVRPGDPVSLDELIAAGWPGERVLPGAARNRVHVALSRLRGLGFGPWIERQADGWSISASIAIDVRARRSGATSGYPSPLVESVARG